MNNLKNEQGYALITVLLIITIFMVLFLSFTGQAFNTAKQNEVVEKKSQATALAEMGVSYYQSLIYNVYMSNRQDFNKQIINYVTSNPNHKTDQELKIDAVLMMKNLIKGKLNDKPQRIEMEDPKAFFTIHPIDPTDSGSSNDEVRISFTSTGSESGKKDVTLSATMKIKLTSFEVKKSGNSDPVTEPKVIPTFNMNPDDFVRNCTNANAFSASCTKLFINTVTPGKKNDPPSTQAVLDGNNNGDSKKSAFSIVPLYIAGNNVHMKNMEFYSLGSIEFRSVTKKVEDITIKTRGSLNFNAHFEPNRSNVYVMGNLLAEQKFKLYQNTFVYVDGTIELSNGQKVRVVEPTVKLTFSQAPVISNSTMCVNGNMKTSNTVTIEDNGRLIVKGTLNGSTYKNINNPSIIADPSLTDQQFRDLCVSSGSTSIPTFNIDWDDDVSREVKYDY